MSEEKNVENTGDFEDNEKEEVLSSHEATSDQETELSSSQKFETTSQNHEEFIVVPVEDGKDGNSSEVQKSSSPSAHSHPNQDNLLTHLDTMVDNESVSSSHTQPYISILANYKQQMKPLVSNVPRGQSYVDKIATSISYARKRIDARPVVKTARTRVPPKFLHLSSGKSLPSKKKSGDLSPSLYYEVPIKPHKVITWDEATNARPPLRIDMEGPGPCTYNPTKKPLNERNAPSYSFGTKCYPEKEGGARTAWSKTWFQSNDVWSNKTDYDRETIWPTPNLYHKGSLLGPRQRTMPEAPSYTFGRKHQPTKQAVKESPSPCEYSREIADKLILKQGPSFSHQFRREGTVLWGTSEINPGPAAYKPSLSPRIQKPAFTIQGIRREKSHVLGPYCTI
ncbi:uncharacterized protein LOC131932952 [Physella acuta]|uniref:uncharacterized protein LOC131932952 n=1 Tax=Physella acuta TaxID=109671 RepID=UPI0027DC59E3|nr:uncharacterized protein LOC131932952 [Physella acuta]